MSRKRIEALLLLGFLLGSGCVAGREDSPSTGEKAKIEKVIETSIGWAMDKDRDALFSSMSQDSALFIFHPDSSSTIVGFEAFREMVDGFFMNSDFKATGFRIKDLRINISESEKTAWFSALLDDHSEWKGEPMGWENARWTGVLEKKNGGWVIVQMHFSLSQ